MLKLISSIKILPRWIVISIDSSIILFSIVLAFFLRFNLSLENIPQDQLFKGGILYFFFCLIAIILNKTYSGIIRYTSIEDGVRILYTTTFGGALAGFANYANYYFYGSTLLPVSVLIIAYFATTLFLFFYRLAVKYIFSLASNLKYGRLNSIIFGASQLGILTKHIIDNDPHSNMKVVGFIDDDIRKVGKNYGGAKIFHAKDDLDYLVRTFNVHKLVITSQDIPLRRKNDLVDFCLKHDIEVQHVPPAYRWVNGELSLNQIRNLKIEDLLGRESIKIENHLVKNDLQGKCIMITGAAGSIGSEIARQLIQNNPKKILLVDQAETPLYDLDDEIKLLVPAVEKICLLGDVTQKERIENIIREHKPNFIFHAAAYKHVPLMEQNPVEAVNVNIWGSKVLADLALKYNVEKFVMVSTDKAVNPTNVMGASKRIAEMYVQSLNSPLGNGDGSLSIQMEGKCKFITTRFGNVLGSNGSVIPMFRKQIEKGGPVTVTHPEITRFFMTIGEACQLVLEACVMGNGGEIFIFDMGEAIRILDLAKKMIQLSGYKVERDLSIDFTGLRPGEKLHEELLNNLEKTIPTHNPKIMIAKVREEDHEHINLSILDLIQVSRMDGEDKTVKKMKELVPEFKSNMSRFEKIDLELKSLKNLAS
jgi:FlaA1/EpsC-like NDP-sugar epimerase